MKKTAVLLLSLSLIVLASAVSAFAQEKEKEKQVTFEREVGGPTEFRLKTQEPDNTFTFLASEFSFDKLVKGAPYSAQAVTETTQTLGDGNRIVNTSSTAVYRDGEGRTRRESTFKAIGPFAPSGEAKKSITIYDPVAGVGYTLDPTNHIARKSHAFRIEGSAQALLQSKATAPPSGDGQNFTFSRTPGGDMQIATTAATGSAEVRMRTSKIPQNVNREELGTQTVEGVSAVGSRTTITIPAGQIGNERAIEIIEERWFSPDLQTMVMTRHADPRSGEVVFRLTNINRAEPDRSLFEVPADYTLKEDQPLRHLMVKPTPEQ